ncbi:ABC transporter substrate-binding protein [Sneathiella sp. HT1-7]|jgi:4,5-dihydroxyphthalate decarboxylase|uniref:ABC transporter substrate-binding protein n=1 Tax=Sneathiella sp. HT1-7 TaxID=2887192 RepID=UPI001D1489B1|nr:ABC transporter substrate-binding protein [Sneathiella sp. HT1-7]MCC3305253.1 ABC transporter substrate-binding protein [Sneathiella sp. HT1-7]
MSKLKLSIAIGDYDRNRALIDGRVQIDGVDPIFMALTPEEMFFRAFRHQDFDISEVSFASQVVSIAQDRSKYQALPIFLSRAFRHSAIYIRTDKGIESPVQLKGKKIGIAEYQLSANVWARAILEDEYGVKPSDIHWVRGGMNSPGRPEKIAIQLPEDVKMTTAPEDKSLNDLLISGEIDGFIGPRSPNCFDEQNSNVGRLFGNTVEVASVYWKKTGIFPIMHLLGVRRELLEAHPFLAGALMKAFSASKASAEALLADTSATKVTMPFVEDHLNEAKKLMGENFWSYGINGNEAALNTFLDHHHRQGLSSRRVTIDELFPKNVAESYSL